MRYLFLIILCFIISGASARSQETAPEKRGYIGFSIGPAIPLGEFGSKDIYRDYSGFAKTGISLQVVNFGYRIGKNLGVAGMWSGASFAFDEEALRSASNLSSIYINIGSYGYSSLMGGLFVSIPTPLVDFDFRAMIGFGYGMIPETHISGYNYVGTYGSISQSSSDAIAIAGDLGVGARFNLTQLINFNLFIDYMSCRPEFSIDYYEGGEYEGTASYEQPMDHLTITAGMGFRLN